LAVVEAESFLYILANTIPADVAELADALASGASVRTSFFSWGSTVSPVFFRFFAGESSTGAQIV